MPILRTRELYEFIMDKESDHETLLARRESLPPCTFSFLPVCDGSFVAREYTTQELVEEEIWLKIDLPRTLMDVSDHHTHADYNGTVYASTLKQFTDFSSGSGDDDDDESDDQDDVALIEERMSENNRVV